MLILLALILVLVACADTEEEPKDVSEKENKSEEKETKVDEEANENDEEADSNDEENGEQQETKIEKTDPDDEQTEEDATTDDKSDSDAESEATEDEKSDEETDEKPSEAGDAEKDILGFGFELFDAQVDEDYDYLESVLSKGSSLDREHHTIQFDNVTSPHAYEFISKEDRDNLDERYIQEEDDGSVIIGFEVIDYMNESSYIIDVQFIQEDDEWKVNDMDINK